MLKENLSLLPSLLYYHLCQACFRVLDFNWCLLLLSSLMLKNIYEEDLSSGGWPEAHRQPVCGLGACAR